MFLRVTNPLGTDLHTSNFPELIYLLQAGTAAYLAHLFACSLMSRWLLQYSPAAVLVRLCSLSIFMSYGCLQLFKLTGALEPNLEHLSRCLPIWVVICVCLLVSYFTTQQDISIDEDRDDRKRRLILRIKCLYAMAGVSLLSLFSILLVVHIGSRHLHSIGQEALLLIRASLQWLTEVTDRGICKDEL